MCGRFTLTTRYQDLADQLQLELDDDDLAQYRPRYNIAPTESTVIAVRDGGRHRLVLARWGMPAPFGPGQDDPVGHINARAETAAGKPAFRGAFLSGRCGVAADGFFEWTGPKGQRQPYWFHRADNRPMLLAGLYRDIVHPGGGERLRHFTILTCAANQLVAPYHRRMPVILDPGAAALASWLDPVAPEGQAHGDKEDREAMRAALSSLLVPAPDDLLVATPVSTRVNSTRHDDPACVEPIELPDEDG
ncbi:MAG: SOS response-associated peptidase [Myxococcales bacterium]|nr:SOS response-associated peptidase [Myxococcales bacterium]